MRFDTPLRYPGGKGRLSSFIKQVLEKNGLAGGHYVEPYAGGAGLALNLLFHDYASCIHINDLNRSLYAFWHSVLHASEELCRNIRDVGVTIEEWSRQKAVQSDPDNHSLLELGFSTFFLNRTNRSGIISAGAIGGKKQDGAWKLDVRFNKEALCRRIEKIAQHASRISLYNLDAADMLTGVIPTLPEKKLVYMDPPYYIKGQGLYEHYYTYDDHVRIAGLVRTLHNEHWIVSYDNAQAIRQLYGQYRQMLYRLSYTAQEKYAGSELMMFSHRLVLPNVSSPLQVR